MDDEEEEEARCVMIKIHQFPPELKIELFHNLIEQLPSKILLDSLYRIQQRLKNENIPVSTLLDNSSIKSSQETAQILNVPSIRNENIQNKLKFDNHYSEITLKIKEEIIEEEDGGEYILPSSPGSSSESMNSIHLDGITTLTVSSQINNDKGHSDSVLKTELNDSSIYESRLCKVCGFLCPYKSALKEHMRSHTGERPYKCDLCDKSYKRKKNLTIHLRNHEGIKPFKCSLCSYGTVDKHSLLRHVATHEGQDKYLCSICDKKFSKLSDYKNHKKNVHQQTEHVICAMCGFITCTQKLLRRHQAIKHKDRKMFVCPACNIVVQGTDNFNLHMKEHKAEQTLCCQKCGRILTNIPPLAEYATSYAEMCLECDTCRPKKTSVKKSKSIKTNTKRYFCKFCPRGTRLKKDLERHVLKVHKISNFSYDEEKSLEIYDSEEKYFQNSTNKLNDFIECLDSTSDKNSKNAMNV